MDCTLSGLAMAGAVLAGTNDASGTRARRRAAAALRERAVVDPGQKKLRVELQRKLGREGTGRRTVVPKLAAF